ncbi:hypothetical protein N7491_007637 [Penicillium cf. griseofulvum]|uniref:Uncharacterized protein n=1 Tax=Penicillium cf. griseofulvum TaxID=2972120 RepID=A0A9W9IV55_9EURO|nr:hypothetical protein N7472_009337 [Penicillium cf. griseofulvum]KAJ5430621.1 hypothetical protein N7491_007637 [Penicillium cf. griseofulvum]KAJ5435610.1 hypothetical protein N7445_006495 [Penicillium cf. griseofulvum]
MHLTASEALDDHCLNVTLHRQSQHGLKHPINVEDLVLDKNLNKSCAPFRTCKIYSAYTCHL